MAKSYSWPVYPVPGIAPILFQQQAYDALNAYQSNGSNMDEEINTARFGYLTLSAFLTALKAGTEINAGAITIAKQDISGTPADGKIRVYRTAAGKEVWETPGSATDTKTVKMDAADTDDYLGQKVDGSSIMVNGSKKLYVPTATASVPGISTLRGVFNVVTATTTAVINQGYLCDTSGGAFTLTLPASPSAGDVVEWKDAAGTFHQYNLTLGRNGKKIMGLDEDMVISKRFLGGKIVYYNATQGWRI